MTTARKVGANPISARRSTELKTGLGKRVVDEGNGGQDARRGAGQAKESPRSADRQICAPDKASAVRCTKSAAVRSDLHEPRGLVRSAQESQGRHCGATIMPYSNARLRPKACLTSSTRTPGRHNT
jgi:hypothetical protein